MEKERKKSYLPSRPPYLIFLHFEGIATSDIHPKHLNSFLSFSFCFPKSFVLKVSLYLKPLRARVSVSFSSLTLPAT